MKQLFFITLLGLVSGFSSCDSRGGSSVMKRATGTAYDVIVVMGESPWNSNTGAAIREELTSPVPYLPQSESSMKITYVRPDQFNGLFQYVRNILKVDIDNSQYTKVTLIREDDKWASGQLVVSLNAPDTQSLEAYLFENQRVLVNYFTKEEMRRTANFLREKYSSTVMEKVKETFGITLYAPSDINKAAKAGNDCLWFSNDAVTGRMDLFIYSFPYTDKNTFTLDYLIAKRDSFAKEMIPGSFPGSYMSTEKRVVDYQASTLNGKYCGIVRGLWRMEGDMMGGPFVSYARVDEPNQRVIITEGFVYEPAYDKRNYIRRLEAALQTTRFSDEQH